MMILERHELSPQQEESANRIYNAVVIEIERLNSIFRHNFHDVHIEYEVEDFMDRDVSGGLVTLSFRHPRTNEKLGLHFRIDLLSLDKPGYMQHFYLQVAMHYIKLPLP